MPMQFVQVHETEAVSLNAWKEWIGAYTELEPETVIESLRYKSAIRLPCRFPSGGKNPDYEKFFAMVPLMKRGGDPSKN